jgi:hypothetical protein
MRKQLFRKAGQSEHQHLKTPYTKTGDSATVLA